MNWEIGIDMYTLICIKWITNKNLLYKKINKIQKFKKRKKKISVNHWLAAGLTEETPQWLHLCEEWSGPPGRVDEFGFGYSSMASWRELAQESH